MPPALSVVMPALDGRAFVERALAPLLAARARGEVLEILLVDDGSTDRTAARARALGVEILTTGPRAGPAAARNAGAARARGDLVLFVDVDVVVHDDVPRLVHETFAADPGCVAVFGSYDDDPADRGLVSTYANLRHHWIHQQSPPEVRTFWAGCGAVRRAAFAAAGGYDTARFPRPSIEDIELGSRLAALGRIRLRRDLLAKHLKRWTLRSLITTDILHRAVPWARLLRARPASTAHPEPPRASELNIRASERAKAALALTLLLTLALLPFPSLYPFPLLALPALLLAAFAANHRFFALLYRRRGPLHALAGFALHQLYYGYATIAWLVVTGSGSRSGSGLKAFV